MGAKHGRQTRLTLGAAFLLMGFSFSITQTLLVREMLVSFAGNELSIGVVLAGWLLLEAVGSGLLGRLAARRGRGAGPYLRLQILFALLLAPVLYCAFGLRHLMGGLPGQGVGLVSIAGASFLLLVPLGLVDGMMFTAACRADDELRRRGGTGTAACRADDELRRGGAATVGRVYVLEAVGGIAGGLAFTYLLVRYLHALEIALILAALNLASALSLALLPPPAAPGKARRRGPALPLAALLALCLGLLLTPGADALHRRLVAWQWRGYDLAFYGNSVYGNVAAIRQREQLTFFANGVPVLTAPVPDVALVEEMVHLPLLYVPGPRRALVLSGGLGGVIRELCKYPLERVDYAELDPLLIQAVAGLPTPLTEAELSDPRLHVETVDGRLLVRRLAQASPPPPAYDLILVNLPYPTTLQLNRFYTVEFWQMVRGLVADEGVVVLAAPGSLASLSPGMRDLHKALQGTLSQAFPHLRPIPGDVTLWLASPAAGVETAEIAPLVERWQGRGLPSELMTDFHIRLKLDGRRLAWFQGALEGGRPVAVNHDLHPSGLLYGLAHWNELFSPGLNPYFALLGRLSLPALSLPPLLLALAGAALLRLRPGGGAAAIPIAIAATGFGGMAAVLLVIFAFQVFYGEVYQLIGLLITAFMGGLSLGGWAAARGEPRPAGAAGWRQEKQRFLALEVALLAFWLALPAALTLLYSGAGWPPVSAALGPALLGLNALAGLLVGAQFPLASRMHLRFHPTVSGAAGALYAADLLGACAAALLVSVALLPALGIAQTCLLVAALKAGSLALVAAMRP